MRKRNPSVWIFSVAFLAGLLMISPKLQAAELIAAKGELKGLSNLYVKTYAGGEDGGLAHVTYWGIDSSTLSPEEKAKADKIKANVIHSSAFDPWAYNPAYLSIAGVEVTGLLKKGKREQSITFRLPDEWNGKLVVAGTPGLRNEYANEAILVPWLLEAGYAYIAGNKGIPGGAGDMVSGNHHSRHWGQMMIDLALFGRGLVKVFSGSGPERTYAMGLSNGGYQTRRALEIDHQRVMKGKDRLFDGGVDWSGAYWPDARVLDADGDGKVSVAEYAAADTLVGHIDRGTLAMAWYHSPDTLSTVAEYEKNPRFAGAYYPMVDAGFSPEAALFWRYYNSNFDPYRFVSGFEIFKGVGYYNLVSYVCRADLRGDDAVASAAYSCYSDPTNPDEPPPIYDWLANAKNGGWTQKSVKYALKNANTGEFSAPLLSLHGQADGLVALNSMGLAYKDAVQRYGMADLYRMYIIAHSGHVDKHVDGGWGADPYNVDPAISDLLTPMQAYAMRTFNYLEAWVEGGELPPDSKLVETDPENDIVDPAELVW